ncbi:ATP-binding protein [Streptomyces katsurahamanus]|uniref:ATP-binding protein n=1 Tax=Streptomyces katsurahamanus TaxID=2577098 RepID=A0ABW9NUH3_9ACTN|nr:ATP-binding protein [Streptomyces katsurahamanus]MQS36694.1 ATP-binding protein [Streptomyces katsurahamanus]
MMTEPCHDIAATLVVSRWSRRVRSVGRARAELRTLLASWGLACIEDSALLVLSELLSNAVQHAQVSPGRDIETRYERLHDGLRIEVHDASDTLPLLDAPASDATSGRGLLLVEALAAKWGVSRRDGPGKAVWAEIATPGEEYARPV